MATAGEKEEASPEVVTIDLPPLDGWKKKRDRTKFVCGKRKTRPSRFKIIPEHNEKDLEDGRKESNTVECKPKAIGGPDSCTKVLQQGAERPGLSLKRFFADFCRKVQEKLEADDYQRFLKCLSIHSAKIISRTQLTSLVCDLLERHPDLMEEFNGFLERGKSIDHFWTGEILDRTADGGRRSRELKVREILDRTADGGRRSRELKVRTGEFLHPAPYAGRHCRTLKFPSGMKRKRRDATAENCKKEKHVE